MAKRKPRPKLYVGRKIGDLTLRGRLSLTQWATVCACGREVVRAAKSLRKLLRSACDECNRSRAGYHQTEMKHAREKSREAIPDIPVRQHVRRFKPIEEQPPLSGFTQVVCRMGFLR